MIDDFIEKYLDFLKEEKLASSNTMEAYTADLKQLKEFLKNYNSNETTSPEAELTKSNIQAYLLSLRERNYKETTLARKTVVARTFIKFLVGEGHLSKELIDGLEAPKMIKGLPKFLTVEEIDDLLEQPAPKNTPESLRDKAMLSLAYGTGLRASELVALNLEDITINSLPVTLRTVGKGEKERILVLEPSSIEDLKRYLEEVRPKFEKTNNGNTDPALFLNRRGARLTRQGFWLIVKLYGQQAGIGFTVTPHMLRHSYATHQLSGGRNLRELQEALGHASLQTTQIYTQLTNEHLREQYDKAHPRA